MSWTSRLFVIGVALLVVGGTLLVLSGVFSSGAADPSSTNAHFLERVAAGLAFMLAYLCYFFSRKQ